jgi:hypothetical protein
MTAKEMIANLRDLGPQEFSALFEYLAEHTYEARLSKGQRLLDASDFKAWFLELADNASRTEVSVEAGSGTRPKVLTPAPQRRYDSRHDPTCPRCGHIHEGVGECAMYMGNGRYCRCELEVPV